MTLSIKQVRYFIATADAGQVSAAAIELNVSQSAVTAAIQQLEADLRVPLFRRHPGGVALTTEGARFLLHARNIMAAVNEAVHTPLTDYAQLAGHVRVGVTYTVAGYFLPRHHARFARSYPGIDIELIELPRRAIEGGLLAGTLDLAVLLVSNLEDRAHLAYEALIRSKRKLWLPVEHPLLKVDAIALADVACEPYIMLTVDEASNTVDRYWKPSGLQPNTIFRTSSVEAVRSLVAAGLGITVLSDMVYRPWSLEGQRIETRSLVADIPTMDVGVVWNPGSEQSAATRTFRDFLSLTFNGPGHD
ncbi:LysR family transcriptional regulator [Dongia sp.]|uniref:LysR family transcriptional regulator n=1 Tax=Dongia sp. TaxID=1977262 RepID=UPI0035B4E0BE